MANLNAIIGLFGAGKTGTACSMALAHMAAGGVVASNINFKADPFISRKFGPQGGFRYALKKLYGWTYQEGQFIYLNDNKKIEIMCKGKPRFVPLPVRFYEHVPRGEEDLHVMVIIDEAHKCFPKDAYMYMPTGETDIISVLRHLNLDLYIMTQAWEHVWSDMRRLCQVYYRVRNLKDGGLGIIAQLPWFIKPVFQIPLALIKLIMFPVLKLLPDFVQIRKFRGEGEEKQLLYEGYPKVKRYSLEVFQSYDSPEAVDDIPTDDDLPNDFRTVEQKKGGVKKNVNKSVCVGVTILILGAFWLCRSFFNGAKDDKCTPVVRKVTQAISQDSPLPVRPICDCDPLEYVWFSSYDVGGNRVAKLSLSDSRVLTLGGVYDGSEIVGLNSDCLVLKDKRRYPLVKFVPVKNEGGGLLDFGADSIKSAGGLFGRK